MKRMTCEMIVESVKKLKILIKAAEKEAVKLAPYALDYAVIMNKTPEAVALKMVLDGAAKKKAGRK